MDKRATPTGSAPSNDIGRPTSLPEKPLDTVFHLGIGEVGEVGVGR